MSKPSVRVLIVDDSRTIRDMFTRFLSEDESIEVVGAAADPHEARQLIKQLSPDIITLDVEMPHMDGLSFLEKIMTLRPMPVVMVSTLTQKGADITLRALEMGAVDFITKPANVRDLQSIQSELRRKVLQGARANVRARSVSSAANDTRYQGSTQHKVIAIGASTGGVEAIRHLLCALPAGLAPIVIVQHMPAAFTAAFARRLDAACPHRVIEAPPQSVLEAGSVTIAYGGEHLCIQQRRDGKLIALREAGDLVSGHKPSVDALFHSLAKLSGVHITGVILTGMGRDGAQGLLALRQAGARTLGQNEASCVVYGMPKAAAQLAATEKELSLEQLAKEIVSIANS